MKKLKKQLAFLPLVFLIFLQGCVCRAEMQFRILALNCLATLFPLADPPTTLNLLNNVR